MSGSAPRQHNLSPENSETSSLSSASLPSWQTYAEEISREFEFKPGRSRAGFQPFCKVPGINLRDFKGRAGWLLNSSAQPDKQQELAKSLIRGLFNTAASTIKDPQYREYFANPGLSDKQLIEALAFVESAERMKCVRALLYLSATYPQIENFLAQKLNNILHFTSTSEKSALIKELLKPESGAPSPEHIRKILGASVDLEQMCQIVADCGKAGLLSLNHNLINEFIARSSILTETRKILSSNAGEQPEAPQARLDKLEAMLEAAGAACICDSACARTVAARRLLRAISSHLSEVRALRHEEKDPCVRDAAIEQMTARLNVEFHYGLNLADERKNTANTHRRWSIHEIEEAREALQRIPEGRLIFTPKLHTIQRVGTLGEHILGMRTDSGIIKIADDAVAHPYVELAYRGESSFQITLTHELGHAIQLGPEGPGLEEAGHEVTIAPGDPCYNFREFMQLSKWQVIAEDRYKIEDAGLSVVLDGVSLPVGVPCRFQDQRIILVYNQGLLLSYDTDAQFSLIDYSRSNPWEDWAESFCEYIMLPQRLLKFAPQKFMYFEEEFRKYAAEGVQALLKRLAESRDNDDQSDLSQAA